MVEDPTRAKKEVRQKSVQGESIEQEKNKDLIPIIQEAEKDVVEAMNALKKANFSIEGRHTVIVPGTSTTPDESRRLLQKEISGHGNEVGVYFCIPYCPYICAFCRYYNRSGRIEDLPRMAEEDMKRGQKEIEYVFEKMKFPDRSLTISSLYIGGGTPTLLTEDSFKNLFEYLRQKFNFSRDIEITVECTPDTINESKLGSLMKYGVNRISMGVQRLDDEWLKSMGRRHTVEDVFRAIELFNKFGIFYNIDLMYGFEGQSVESFLEDVKTLIDRGVPQITLYRLETAKRTDDRPIKVERESDEITFIMAHAARKLLLQSGYSEGPDGWFTKPGYQSPKVYTDRWERQIPLLGFGPEAYSYSGKQQHTNLSYREYVEAIDSGKEVINPERSYLYTEFQQRIRKIIFELRFFKTDITDVDENLKNFFQGLSNVGLGEIITQDKSTFFVLNEKGKIVIQEIIRHLYKMSQEAII